MKFDNTQVMNFEGAFRGLRNPLESWNKSDSIHYFLTSEYSNGFIDEIVRELIENDHPDIDVYSHQYDELFEEYLYTVDEKSVINPFTDPEEHFWIGPNDMDLAHRMIKAGSSDRKFMRQIMVSVDITAPLYWWKEFDTYKVGTTANSTSTMHKLASTPITKECFEMDDVNADMLIYEDSTFSPPIYISEYWDMLINDLEYLRKKYNETKDKRYWKELIRLLPEAWLQTRTVTLNYEVLRNIYSQRKNHRLSEWHTFCSWIQLLPYSDDLIRYGLD